MTKPWPAIPVLISQGHEWHLLVVTKSSERVIVREQITIASTRNVCDALKIIAVLHWLLDWAETVLAAVVLRVDCWAGGMKGQNTTLLAAERSRNVMDCHPQPLIGQAGRVVSKTSISLSPTPTGRQPCCEPRIVRIDWSSSLETQRWSG
jgi:hypothetical protein